MTNGIIIGIVVILAFLAIGTRIRRTGRKGCCGSGSDYKTRKKKLAHVNMRKTFVVEGMHCEKCSNRVMEVINDIPHVSANVDLKKGIAVVSYEEDVADDLIKSRLERAGYPVREIRA